MIRVCTDEGVQEIPYRVFRQSSDYLYGWNWQSDDEFDSGLGYRTKKSATEAALQHFKTGESRQWPRCKRCWLKHRPPNDSLCESRTLRSGVL